MEHNGEGRSVHGPAAHGRDKGWYAKRPDPSGRADSRRPTTEVALPQTPSTLVYRCLKNAPRPAILCHFSARQARLPGGQARSANRCSIMRSDLTWAWPGDPKTEWHEAPRKVPPRGRPDVHYLARESLPDLDPQRPTQRVGKSAAEWLRGVPYRHGLSSRGLTRSAPGIPEVARPSGDRPRIPGGDVRNVHAVTPQACFLNHAEIRTAKTNTSCESR
jgi:hypothetical protein